MYVSVGIHAEDRGVAVKAGLSAKFQRVSAMQIDEVLPELKEIAVGADNYSRR